MEVQVGNSGAPIHVVKQGGVGFNMLCSMGRVEPKYRGHADWVLDNGVQLRPELRGRHLFAVHSKSHFQGDALSGGLLKAGLAW